MLAKVRKTMQSDTGLLQAGDIVDVSTWRNTKTLLASRYIELAENAPISKPKAEKKVETAEVEPVVEVKTEKTKSKK